MTSWELARYLIDAKKCVDSVMYIEDNQEKLKHINLREQVDEKRKQFYINCCTILDKSFPKKKKDLCQTDSIVKSLYYERDKNIAHKDDDYKAIQYNSLSDIISELKIQIRHLREICKDSLPAVITLDFVSHDSGLYRLANGITVEKQESIEKEKYPLRGNNLKPQSELEFMRFEDREDIKNIEESNNSKYGVMIENGINLYEGVQNRQDSAIRCNVLFGGDVWCTLNQDIVNKYEKLQKLGLFDEHGIFRLEVLNNPNIEEEALKVLGDNERDSQL